jgi:hypothetical protein
MALKNNVKVGSVAALMRTADEIEQTVLQKLDQEVESLKAEIKALVVDAVEESQQDLVFRDLEPARLLAEKTAKAEIQEFKKHAATQVKGALESVKKSREDALNTIASKTTKEVESFNSKLNSLILATEKNIAAIRNNHQSQIDSLVTRLESMRGPQGEQGPQGNAGKDGANGKDGKDGSPDTPNQVVSKVNEAQRKVEIESIKGLKKELADLRKEVIRAVQSGGGAGGGGGMGTPQHETFSGGGTSFTLSSNVAAGGNAIWLYLQGQFLLKDNHYTVSGKTITTTFTVAADEVLDVTYIRS